MAFIWSPLAATATRNLPPDLAGAGSGVYNATRQVGSVLGSAGIAAFMTSRISAEMPLAADGPGGEGSVTELPGFLHEPFASAMSQSLLLPAFIALFGVVAAMFLLGFASPSRPGDRSVPAAGTRRPLGDDDDFRDDDDYVEFTVMGATTSRASAAARCQSGDAGGPRRAHRGAGATRARRAGRADARSAPRATRNRRGDRREPVAQPVRLPGTDPHRHRNPSPSRSASRTTAFHVVPTTEASNRRFAAGRAARRTARTRPRVDRRRSRTGFVDDEPRVQRQAFARRTRRYVAPRSALRGRPI